MIKTTPDLPAPAETRVDKRTGPPPDPAYPCLQPPAGPGEIGRLGGYRVLRLLGEGGMGLVFLAEDVALRRHVALKVMKYDAEGEDGEGTRRFLREARSMAGIKDDHLVTVFQAGMEGTTAYMAMELLVGESLQARLSRNAWPEPTECLRIAQEIAQGLATIHANGLVHRDIKPSNLWIESGSGRVKILDFGLVREVHTDSQITATGMIVGTPAFLAPEQARGKKCDGRTDLFSLGCVLYHLCTGEQPFPAENAMEQLVAVVADEPVPLLKSNPDVPERLARLVHSMLAKNPDRRPPTAQAVADELSRIIADLETPEPEPAGPPTAPTKRLVSVRAEVVREKPAAKDRSSRVRRPVRRRRKKKKSWAVQALCGGVVLIAVVAGLTAAKSKSRPPAAAKSSTPEPAAKTDPPPKSTPTVKVSPPPEPAAPARAFLADLKVVPSQTKNWPFSTPPGVPAPPGDLSTVVVNGKLSPNGLLLHPAMRKGPGGVSGEAARVTYELGGGYTAFTADVSINDSARGGGRSPMTFAVYLDGERKWTSRPVQAAEHGQTVSLDVTGAQRITLEVSSAGDPGGCHGVWVEPTLTK